MSRSELVNCLLSPQAYPHASEKVELRETHISYVFLTGEYAYKLKKPLNLGFADFTTLENRRRFCFEEVRRNQLFSPGIYLDAVPVALSGGVAVVGSESPGYPESPIDYLVRMRQFDDSQLSNLLAQHSELTADDLSDLARRVAGYHQSADRSQSGVWGTPNDILQSALENIQVLRGFTTDSELTRQLDRIEKWTLEELNRLTPIFHERKARGFIRECHGDLHLGNVVRWQGRLTPFDCIEFNPDFYWIDVLSEVAFLVMDLDDHGLGNLGWHFLNAYLEHTGDYEGLRVFRFYLVYRAMVRAKICELRLQQSQIAIPEQRSLNDQWRSYLYMAALYTQPTQACLAITHGVSGSGKTYSTQATVRESRVIRIRSDVERMRMSCDYSEEGRDSVYSLLADLAKTVLDANYSVLVDATFLKFKHRQLFRRIAVDRQVAFYILKFDADTETLRRRIAFRLRHTRDQSEATQVVLEQQLQQIEPLNSAEENDVVQDLPKLRISTPTE